MTNLQSKIVHHLEIHGATTSFAIAASLGASQSGVRNALRGLVEDAAVRQHKRAHLAGSTRRVWTYVAANAVQQKLPFEVPIHALERVNRLALAVAEIETRLSEVALDRIRIDGILAEQSDRLAVVEANVRALQYGSDPLRAEIETDVRSRLGDLLDEVGILDVIEEAYKRRLATLKTAHD